MKPRVDIRGWWPWLAVFACAYVVVSAAFLVYELATSNGSFSEQCHAALLVLPRTFAVGVAWLFAAFDFYRDDIAALSTLVVAAFTGVLGIFTISLARSTRIAADAANLSAKVAQSSLADLERPYVFIETQADIKARLGFRDVMPSGGGDPVRVKQIPRVKFRLVNHGRTPAIVSPLIKRDLIFYGEGPNMAPDSIDDMLLKNEVILAPNGGGSDWYVCEFNGTWPDDVVQAMTDLEMFFWFRAWISYQDVFGKSHVAPACRQYLYSTDALLPEAVEAKYRT
jgi:hypothetical protein